MLFSLSPSLSLSQIEVKRPSEVKRFEGKVFELRKEHMQGIHFLKDYENDAWIRKPLHILKWSFL